MKSDLVFNIAEACVERASIFLSSLLGSSYPVSSAIKELIYSGFSYGEYTNEEVGPSFFDNEQQLVEYANLRFFDVLCGKCPVGLFVTEIFTRSVAYTKEISVNETKVS